MLFSIGWMYGLTATPFGPSILKPCFNLDRNELIIIYESDSWKCMPFIGGSSTIQTNLSVCQFQSCGQLFSSFRRKVFIIGESSFQTLRLLRCESHLTAFSLQSVSREYVAWMRIQWRQIRRCCESIESICELLCIPEWSIPQSIQFYCIRLLSFGLS